MVVDNHFDIGNFITESLCLQANAPTRALPSKPIKNMYEKYYNQNPLDVLGEQNFGKFESTPKDDEETQVQEFYRGAHVLITGGTGFLGKLLTEKLVRSVPQLGHVYLLIRPKRGKGSRERFDTLLEDKVFRRMREEVPGYLGKMSAVAGDLYEPGLGLSAADRQLLLDRVHVVFHSAADVKFIDPLKVAIEANVMGSRRVLDLATQITHLKAFLHVSTAFSHCVRRVIPESIPRMSIPYKDILNYIETHGDDPQDSEIIRLMQGWPNTYTFSKALCEIMLEEEYHTLPIAILRPSVIAPTYKEPVRGWTDNLNGPLALMVAAGMGVLHGYHIDEELSQDMVPADYVVNAIICATMHTGTKNSMNIPVFNYTAMLPQKSWCWKHVFRIATDSIKRWPFNKAVWYISYKSHTNRAVYELKHLVFHKAPAWIADKLLLLRGQQPRHMKIFKKVDELKPQQEFFAFNCFEFEKQNVKQLWSSLGERDKLMFHFDTSNYDAVENMVFSTLGTKYYVFKEDIESLPAARRRYNWLYWIHTGVKLACWLGMLSLAARLARALPL